jgi:hypothetical protein
LSKVCLIALNYSRQVLAVLMGILHELPPLSLDEDMQVKGFFLSGGGGGGAVIDRGERGEEVGIELRVHKILCACSSVCVAGVLCAPVAVLKSLLFSLICVLVFVCCKRLFVRRRFRAALLKIFSASCFRKLVHVNSKK